MTGRAPLSSRYIFPVAARLAVFHDSSADYFELDFAGAFENRQHPRVAPVALHVELHRVAIAAVNLHRLAGDMLGCLGREDLGHTGLVIAALAAILLRR